VFFKWALLSRGPAARLVQSDDFPKHWGGPNFPRALGGGASLLGGAWAGAGVFRGFFRGPLRTKGGLVRRWEGGWAANHGTGGAGGGRCCQRPQAAVSGGGGPGPAGGPTGVGGGTLERGTQTRPCGTGGGRGRWVARGAWFFTPHCCPGTLGSALWDPFWDVRGATGGQGPRAQWKAGGPA